MTKQRAKKKYMSDDDFDLLMESLNDALAFAEGKSFKGRVTILMRPPKPMSSNEIVKLRNKYKCTQIAFASYLNVSVKTIRAWEQGTRKPGQAALKLLAIAKKYPDALNA